MKTECVYGIQTVLKFPLSAILFPFLITHRNIRMHLWNSSHKFTSILLGVAIKGTNLIILEYRNGTDTAARLLQSTRSVSGAILHNFENLNSLIQAVLVASVV